MTYNISLDPMTYMEPGEIRVLKNIFESDFMGGQDTTVSHTPIPSLQSLCNHIVRESMTCPTRTTLVENKGRHTVVSQGCESYPFPFNKSTWPRNGGIKPNPSTSTKHMWYWNMGYNITQKWTLHVCETWQICIYIYNGIRYNVVMHGDKVMYRVCEHDMV